jgi:MFS family permease
MLALYGGGAVVGIALGGRLTDALGTRAVMVGSLVGNALALFALAMVDGAAAFAVGLPLLGLVAEAFRPANAAAVAAFAHPARRVRAFTLYRLAINAGFTIGPAVGGRLAGVGYVWLFVVDGVTCLAAALLLVLLLPARPAGERTDDVGGEAAAGAAGAAGAGGARGRSPWSDRVFVGAFVLILVQGMIFMQMHSTWPLFLRNERGLAEARIGDLFAVNTLVIVLFEMVLVARIQHLRPLPVIGVAGGLVGLGFGLLPFAAGLPAIVGTVLLWTLGEMLGAPMMQTWVADRADERSRGRYLAALALCFSFCSVLAPLGGTALYERVGPDAVWYAALLGGVVQVAGFRWLARAERRGSQASSPPGR